VVLAIDDDRNVIYLSAKRISLRRVSGDRRHARHRGTATARQLKPLAIILDILMPHKDGWQVLHELKTDVATRDIPVWAAVYCRPEGPGLSWEPSTICSNSLTVRPFCRVTTHLAQRITASWWLMTTQTWWIWSANSSQNQPYEIEAAVDDRQLWRPWPSASLISFCLDLLMPHLDGFGVLEYLASHAPLSRHPVIVLTAKTCTAEEQALLHARVRTVIQKQG